MTSSVAANLAARHVKPELYTVHIDEDKGVATFMLFDLSGALCGYQQYRPSATKEKKNHPREGRYYTYRIEGRTPVFGLETWSWSRALFIVEGIFDCVRIHNLGYSAVAVLSNDPKHMRSWFRAMSRPIFAICDGGAAGTKLAKFGHRHAVCPVGRDLGDMCDSEVQSIVGNLAVDFEKQDNGEGR